MKSPFGYLWLGENEDLETNMETTKGFRFSVGMKE